MFITSEWFWSEKSANMAGERLRTSGYSYTVTYAMDAGGRNDWLLKVFAAD